jgi:hypothetical protein
MLRPVIFSLETHCLSACVVPNIMKQPAVPSPACYQLCAQGTHTCAHPQTERGREECTPEPDQEPFGKRCRDTLHAALHTEAYVPSVTALSTTHTHATLTRPLARGREHVSGLMTHATARTYACTAVAWSEHFIPRNRTRQADHPK